MTSFVTAKLARNILAITAGILAVPLIAMQFTSEVQWDITDFVIIGTLLIAAGFGYLVAVRNVKNQAKRDLIAFVFASIVILLWIEMAVGIFD